MNKYIILAIGVLALVGGFIFFYKSPAKSVEQPKVEKPVVTAPAYDCNVTDQGVIVAVNKFRAEKGLNPVSENSRLNVMADYRANELNGVSDNHAGAKPY